MTRIDLAPADISAGAGLAVTAGQVYYDPGWGRWLVNLGGGHRRTATPREVHAARQATLAAGCRIDQSTEHARGK